MASTSAGIDPVSFSLRGFARATAFQRRYRMDAAILLLGAPLFSRRAAGGAYASVEISGNQGSTATALQFAAGSSPARAHGLNRFGILREAVVERTDGTELSFAGLMTRSGEETFEQGRKALLSRVRAAEGVVARGTTAGSTIQTWIDNIALSPDCDWSNVNQTLGDALRRQPSEPPREISSESAATFLHAMREAALCGEAVQHRKFTHAGKFYWLETRRQPEHPLELIGTIHDLNGARRAEFRTAYTAGDESGIPMRIEYRPRSFLRLTFEAELEATQPAIHSLFHEALFHEGAGQEESA
ncbi:MAG: hypothetical protein WBE37_26660 [Bryobacteraceae bacterium]